MVETGHKSLKNANDEVSESFSWSEASALYDVSSSGCG